MQLRPIQTHVALRPFLTANEDFALSVAFRMLEVDENRIDPTFYQTLAYSLRFDRMDHGALMSLCVLLHPTLATKQKHS